MASGRTSSSKTAPGLFFFIIPKAVIQRKNPTVLFSMHLWLPSLQSDLNSNKLQQTFAQKKIQHFPDIWCSRWTGGTGRNKIFHFPCFLKNVAFSCSCLLSSEWNLLKTSIKSLKSSFPQRIDKVLTSDYGAHTHPSLYELATN